jgi:hypothetical protein
MPGPGRHLSGSLNINAPEETDQPRRPVVVAAAADLLPGRDHASGDQPAQGVEGEVEVTRQLVFREEPVGIGLPGDVDTPYFDVRW